MDNVIRELTETLNARKGADPDTSYVASLYIAGLNKILEKVGEEATEVILAAKDTEDADDASHLVRETADLWFHTMVMLTYLNVSPLEVLEELKDRFGVSGITEKENRDTEHAN